VWQYISLGYLKEKVELATTGSSTMPHKVNPILFENAEGNLVIANALLELFSSKLPVSRMQRDLTDSTVTRNIGTAFGHTILAIKNIQAGLRKIEPDLWKITVDLDSHPEVITEGLQCILRSEGDSEAYNKFKTFLRTTKTRISLEKIREFIRKEFSNSPRLDDLLSLTPHTYFPVSKK
jgi:adenylosuccinate lyase